MSTTLHESESFVLTKYYGGAERGVCYQIGTAEDFVQLTQDDAVKLAAALAADFGPPDQVAFDVRGA